CEGRPTTDAERVAALLPFGAHKGYGLGLVNEIFAAFIGGDRPTKRGQFGESAVGKPTTCFYFQVTHPEAISCDNYAGGRSLKENIATVLNDILCKGNESAIYPGALEASHARKSNESGGLLFTAAEIEALGVIAK